MQSSKVKTSSVGWDQQKKKDIFQKLREERQGEGPMFKERFLQFVKIMQERNDEVKKAYDDYVRIHQSDLDFLAEGSQTQKDIECVIEKFSDLYSVRAAEFLTAENYELMPDDVALLFFVQLLKEIFIDRFVYMTISAVELATMDKSKVN